METLASSSSPVADLAAWGHERVVRWHVFALVAAMVALAFLASPPHDVGQALIRAAFAGIVVLQLRLWDDLADREHDRRRHPARVLSRRTAGNRPFVLAIVVAGGAAFMLMAAMPDAAWRIAGYAMLLGALALAYATLHARAVRGPVVLLKYPAIVMLAAAPAFEPRALLAAATVYALVALYDRLSDSPAAAAVAATREGPSTTLFETPACPGCGDLRSTFLVHGEDDLTGKPGRFRFVRCDACALAYQSPRLRIEHIGAYYDDEYIAHRKRTDWGPLKPLYEWTMDKHDRDKLAIVRRHVRLGEGSRVLDVGCGAGTFVAKVRKEHGAQVSAVDFKDLSATPWMQGVEFHHGLFSACDFGECRFDLVTMWHFLEHDYEPRRTLATARELLAPGGRLVIEVPRLDSVTWALYHERWPGLQAPQHTVLFDRKGLEAMVRAEGFEILEYMPYGAFPPYFYVFAGAAFKLLRGKGLDLRRAILPYFAIQLLLLPVLLLQKHLNLAMQTVVCRRIGDEA